MKGKKGFGGDGFGIVIIIVVLAVVGFGVPLIASAIGSDAIVTNIDGVRAELQDASGSISLLIAGKVLLEIFFFALLGVPPPMALFFTLLAVVLFVLGFRTIRGN